MPSTGCKPNAEVDLSGAGTRPGVEVEVSIVAAPLSDLNPVQRRVGFCVRYVNDCNAPARLAQGMPKTGLVAARRRGEAADIARYIDLIPTVELVSVCANAGGESHP